MQKKKTTHSLYYISRVYCLVKIWPRLKGWRSIAIIMVIDCLIRHWFVHMCFACIHPFFIYIPLYPFIHRRCECFIWFFCSIDFNMERFAHRDLLKWWQHSYECWLPLKYVKSTLKEQHTTINNTKMERSNGKLYTK